MRRDGKIGFFSCHPALVMHKFDMLPHPMQKLGDAVAQASFAPMQLHHPIPCIRIKTY